MTLTLEQVKSKSAARLKGLLPVVGAAAAALVELSYRAGVPIVITQGLRTNAEQDALYAQGRTAPGPIVTNARAGKSYHNHGVAIDFALLLPDGRNVSWDMKLDGDCDGQKDWLEVVAIAKQLGFAWGGDWTSFKDYPHFEMTFGLTASQYGSGRCLSDAQLAAAQTKINAALTPPTPPPAAEIVPKVVRLADNKLLAIGRIEEGKLIAPVADVLQALGLAVKWDNDTKKLYI